MAKVIAEIGINHNGQLCIAKDLVRMARKAGADYVKFQMRDVGRVYAGQLNEPRNDGNPYGWKTLGDQKGGIELTIDDYRAIDELCDDLGIEWFASCWDLNSLDKAIKTFEWPFHKVASAMVTRIEFLERIASTGTPVILSTGGCTMEQIHRAAIVLRRCDLIIMHCVAQYPCPSRGLNLRMIDTLKRSFPWARVGYSGHEVGLPPSIMAIAMGAEYIERHITIDRSMYGSDQPASMEEHGLTQLCTIAHTADTIIGDGVKRVLPDEAKCMLKLRYWER